MSPRRAENPPLDRDLLADDPIEQFAIWFQQAEAIVPLAEAMTLATVDEEGSPDARMVLLKGFGPDGFRFFSNYESTKGVELAAIPRAALIIYWRELDRQVPRDHPIAIKVRAALQDLVKRYGGPPAPVAPPVAGPENEQAPEAPPGYEVPREGAPEEGTPDQPTP